MAEKPRSIVKTAVVIGILTAASAAVLAIVVLNNLWWSLQESFGHAMFHKLEDIVMGAEYMQYFSLLIVMAMAAGALTVYFCRATVRDDRAAARAGMLTGLAIAIVFCLAATGIFIFVSSGQPDSNLWYLAANALRVLAVSLVVPTIVIMPLAVAGAFVMRRSLSGVESAASRIRYRDLLAAAVVAIMLAGILTVMISRNYDIPPVFPAIFSIPLLLTLPLLAAGMDRPYKEGSTPAIIVILALSIIAIVVLPLAGTWLACKAGVIYAEPYEWENPALPDVYVWAASNTSYPLTDLARNLSERSYFDWGASMISGQGDEANLRVIEHVNAGLCDLGVIGRTLTPDEAALGLNQTIIGNNSAIGQVVFVTKGHISANLTRFIDYATGHEGQDIFNRSTTVPY